MPGFSTLLLIGGAAVVSALLPTNMYRRRRESLRSVARRRGGQFDPGGWLRVASVQLTSPERIQIDISQWSTNKVTYTEYNAYIPSPGLPRCNVAPNSITGRLGQDIVIGLTFFDDVFVVKGDDPALVKRMWTRTCCELMSRWEGGATLECSGTDLKLLLSGRNDPEAEEIERGIDFILALARTDPYGIAALQALPERRMRTTTESTHAELPGPSKIHAGPREQGGVVRTCVWTVAVGAPDADLPEDVATNVTALGASLDRTSAELRLWWPGIETDPRRLMAAVELLRRISSAPTLGVFR